MISLVVALQIAAATPAQAAPDPAIASEVRRGWRVAHACAGPKTWSPVSTCISDALDKNRKDATGRRGFGLGISVATWAMARAMLPTLASDPSEAAFAASSIKLARIAAQGRAGRLGLSDDELPKLLPVSADEWRAPDAPSTVR